MYLTLAFKRPPDRSGGGAGGGTRLMLSVIVAAVFAAAQVRTDTVFSETVVANKRILSLADSPYLIQQDVVVEESGELVIEPGVTLRFGRGAGITVRGVLTAEGLPDSKIVMTAAGDTWRQENRTVRLVDGPNVQQGIVQVRNIQISTSRYLRNP